LAVVLDFHVELGSLHRLVLPGELIALVTAETESNGGSVAQAVKPTSRKIAATLIIPD
jgi:hypothetical protein